MRDADEMPDPIVLNSARRRLAGVVALAVVALVGTGCASSGGSGASSGTSSTTVSSAPTATASGPSLAKPCGRTTAPPSKYDHVVIIMEENRTWTGGNSPAVGLDFSPGVMPFLHGLATKCASYAGWLETNPTQDSLTQYIGVTSGVDNPSTVNDCSPSATCRSTDNNLFRQVRAAKGTPRTYVEDATEPCSPGNNAVRHIPALYYQGGQDPSYCKAEVRPLKEFDPNHLPTLSYLVPSLCNDGHDCADSSVDSWATTTLTPILDGASYRAGRTLVVVVWDEDRQVPNLLIAPTAHAGLIRSIVGSHADLLETVELALGLPIMQQGQLTTAVSLRPSAHI